MKILIVHDSKIPVHYYGGIQRVIWYLGQSLNQLGHEVSYLVDKGSHCDFAKIHYIDRSKPIAEQIPPDIDIIHFNDTVYDIEKLTKPYVVTIHGSTRDHHEFDLNSIFVSKNHAERYGSKTFSYNGLNWSDYSTPNWQTKRRYFHFLAKASWPVKNVQGAINIIKHTQNDLLYVLGGKRLNFKRRIRLTLSQKIQFFSMVGGQEKLNLLNGSKGLLFPVRGHETFGLSIIESLYYGCPVFGTPYGSLPELIGKQFGHLSRSRSELTYAIKNSTFDKKKCHEYAADMFNSKLMAQAYLHYYERVLNGEHLNPQPPKLIESTPKYLEWIA